jgi:exodeoxyribonuclease VII large subunit
VARTDEFAGRIDRLHERLVAAAHGRVQRLSRRVHVAGSRPAMAGYAARLAMKSRRAAELDRSLDDAIRLAVGSRARRLQSVRRQLDMLHLSHQLGTIRTRLVAAAGRLAGAMARKHHQADAALRGCANRLETLSPLAVLGRGYAVCWNADRTRALREAGEVAPGDTVRVTLSRGEIEAKVSRTE